MAVTAINLEMTYMYIVFIPNKKNPVAIFDQLRLPLHSDID
jgi:hypothetical protein